MQKRGTNREKTARQKGRTPPENSARKPARVKKLSSGSYLLAHLPHQLCRRLNWLKHRAHQRATRVRFPGAAFFEIVSGRLKDEKKLSSGSYFLAHLLHQLCRRLNWLKHRAHQRSTRVRFPCAEIVSGCLKEQKEQYEYDRVKKLSSGSYLLAHLLHQLCRRLNWLKHRAHQRATRVRFPGVVFFAIVDPGSISGCW